MMELGAGGISGLQVVSTELRKGFGMQPYISLVFLALKGKAEE